MTIVNQSTRVTVQGNGAQTVFDYNFSIPSKDAAKLYLVDAATGVASILPASAWSLSGANNPLGGTFTYPAWVGALPLQSNQKLTLVRAVPNTQITSLQNQSGFQPRTIESALDRIVMQIQQAADEISRSFRLSEPAPSNVSTILASPVANSLIGWDASATALQNISPESLGVIVAYGTARADLYSGDGTTTQFSLTGNPGNQATLDVSVGGVTKRPGVDYFWAGGSVLTFSAAPAAGTNNILVRYFQGLPGIITEAQDVTFLPNGVGAVTRTVQDKLRDTVSVQDFGAVGNGVADDTLAIQNAVDAFPTAGGTLYFPAGRYRVTDTITVLNKCVSFQGAGSGQLASITSGTYIEFDGIGTKNGLVFDNVDGASMRDIAIVAKAATRPTGGYLVVYQGTSSGFYHATWDNVMVDGGYNGMWWKNGFFFHAYSCIWKNMNGDHVLLLNGASNSNDVQAVTFVNCNIAAASTVPLSAATTDVVVLDGFVASTKFSGCSILFGRHGLVQKNSTGGDYPRFTYFANGGFENCQGDAIRLENGDHFMMANAYASVDGGRSRVMYVGPNFGGEITVAGSYMRAGGRGGIWLEDGNAVITGNTIVNNNEASATQYTITSAVNNGSGLIRIETSAAHNFETNDMVDVIGIVGTTEANGIWIVTVISTTQFDLTQNAESDTGATSAFVNAYASGGTVQLATASVRALPTAEWVTISGNNLGGGSSGQRQTEFGIHSAGSNIISHANNIQRVNRAPYQSINNQRTNASRYNLGLATDAGMFDPYQVDGVLSFTQSGTVTAGSKNFTNQLFVTGCKIRIVRVTRNLSSGTGNPVTINLQVDGITVANYSQNGSTLQDTVLTVPIIIDGTVTAKRVSLNLSTSGTPTDLVFEAQYQIITG